MPVIANTHPKGGVGKTTSSVNIVGEMKSDTVDLDTHTGLSIILGLRPEGKEISVKVPKTVDELIEIMTPYKNSDKTLLIDCGGFDSDLTRTAIAFADCVIVPSKDSLTERIGLMHFDGVLDEISSIMGTDITAHLNRPGFPGECFICELRLPDHRFRWKHNKLFLLLPEEYGPAFPAIVDCYTSPPT
ncbi:ParA family protein [Escherichia coli]|nr:ParA family protein [Escherichia coli]